MEHYETLTEDIIQKPKEKILENLNKIFEIKNGRKK